MDGLSYFSRNIGEDLMNLRLEQEHDARLKAAVQEFDDLTADARIKCESARLNLVESSAGLVAVKEAFRPSLIKPSRMSRRYGYHRDDREVRTWDLLATGKNSLVGGLTRAERKAWRAVTEDGVPLIDGFTKVKSAKLVEVTENLGSSSSKPVVSSTLTFGYLRMKSTDEISDETLLLNEYEPHLLKPDEISDVRNSEFIRGDRAEYARDKCAELEEDENIQDNSKDTGSYKMGELKTIWDMSLVEMGDFNYSMKTDTMVNWSNKNQEATRTLGEILVAVCRQADIDPARAFARVPEVYERVVLGYSVQDTW